MTETKRKRGRPRKDEYDEDGNLLPPEVPVSATEPEVNAPELPPQMSGDQAVELLKAAAQTPEGRALLGLQAGEFGAAGVYRRNYDREDQLKVRGGVEVRHGKDFRPLPPSSVTMYVREDGTETNHLDPYYTIKEEAVPKKVDGKFVTAEDGSQIFEKKQVKVLQDPGAARINGQPVFTETYKRFLDAKSEGRPWNSKVETMNSAPGFVGSDPGIQ